MNRLVSKNETISEPVFGCCFVNTLLYVLKLLTICLYTSFFYKWSHNCLSCSHNIRKKSQEQNSYTQTHMLCISTSFAHLKAGCMSLNSMLSSSLILILDHAPYWPFQLSLGQIIKAICVCAFCIFNFKWPNPLSMAKYLNGYIQNSLKKTVSINLE